MHSISCVQERIGFAFINADGTAQHHEQVTGRGLRKGKLRGRRVDRFNAEAARTKDWLEGTEIFERNVGQGNSR